MRFWNHGLSHLTRAAHLCVRRHVHSTAAGSPSSGEVLRRSTVVPKVGYLSSPSLTTPRQVPKESWCGESAQRGIFLKTVAGAFREGQILPQWRERRAFSTAEGSRTPLDELVQAGQYKEAMVDAWTLSHKLWGEGKVDECLPLAEIVLKCSRKVHGQDEHMDVAEALNNKGIVLARMSRFEESAPLLEEALAMKRSLVGNENKAVAETLRNLGNICAETGKFDEAEAWYAECIQILTKTNETALLRHTLQMISWGFGQANQQELANKYAQQLQELAKSAPPTSTLEDFWGLFHKAHAAAEQGGYEEAIQGFEGALHALQQVVPPPANEQALVAKCLVNSATALFSLGNLDGAELFVGEGIARLDAAPPGGDGDGDGDLRHDRMAALNTLGSVHLQRGRFEESRAVFEEALALHQQLQGAEDPARAVYLMNLGQAELKLGKVEEAVERLNEALDVHMQLGVEDLVTGKVRRSLGVASFAAGRGEDAVAWLQQAMAVFRRVGGEEHAEVALSLSALGHVLLGLQRHAEAISALSEGLELARKVFGDEHGQVVYMLDKLGGALFGQGQMQEALEKFEEALETQRKLDPEDGATASLCGSVGAIQWNLGRWEACVPVFEEQRALLVKLFGEADPRVKEVDQRLSDARAQLSQSGASS